MNTKGVMISEICNLCKYYGKIKKMKIQSYPYLHLGDKYFMRRVIKVYSLILGSVMMFMQGACYTSSGNSYI